MGSSISRISSRATKSRRSSPGFAELPFREALFPAIHGAATCWFDTGGEGEYPASYGAAAEEANPGRLPFPDFLVPAPREGRRVARPARGIVRPCADHRVSAGHADRVGHSDAPHFERVVGISLAGAARIALSPVCREVPTIATRQSPSSSHHGSAYAMEGDIRWRWQHHIPPTRELRYSITFRTLRDDAKKTVASQRW